MGEIVGQTGIFNLRMVISLEEKKIWIKLRLKIDLVSLPPRSEGLDLSIYLSKNI